MHLEIATPELLKYSYQDFITAQVESQMTIHFVSTYNFHTVFPHVFWLIVWGFVDHLEGWDQGTVAADPLWGNTHASPGGGAHQAEAGGAQVS